MPNSLFGQMVSASDITQATEDALKKWYITYIRTVERKLDLNPGTIQEPTNYTNRNKVDAEFGEQIPKVVIVCPGLVGPPRKKGNGYYDATWRLGVAVACADADEDVADMLSKAYGLATRKLILDKLRIGNVVWIDENYDDIPLPNKVMQYKAAGLFFTVDMQNVVLQGTGPDEPTEDDIILGQVETIGITIIKEPINA